MADFLHKNGAVSAKLHSIEDDFAYFVLNDLDQNIVQWPLSQLPEGIEIGDEVKITIEFELAEERKAKLKKQAENEAKYQEMRKMLEELVN